MEAKPTKICRQVLTNGHFCKCPALRSGDFCYYHNRDRQRRRIFEKSQQIQRGYDAKRESRTEEEFNHEVVFSLQLPALDDKASIHVACTNLMRALYCDHISVAKARVMMRAIAEANLSLRRGDVLNDYKQPVLESDPEPITPLGHSDPDGCVLPEERGIKAAIVADRREKAARADAEITAARARGENPPPRPLTPEEAKEAALEARRAESDAQLLEIWQTAVAQAKPGTFEHSHASSELAATQERIAARNNRRDVARYVSAPAGMSVPQMPSEGHGFSRAENDPRGAELQLCDSGAARAGASAPGGRSGLQASVTNATETGALAPACSSQMQTSPRVILSEAKDPSSRMVDPKGTDTQASPIRAGSPEDSSANSRPQNDAGIGMHLPQGGGAELQLCDSGAARVGASAPGGRAGLQASVMDATEIGALAPRSRVS